uniref:Uncharacterized protein n=1 Tax=Anguilla anguilla TaxID=7936 RepID=A0A0E9PZI9_ANGAN
MSNIQIIAFIYLHRFLHHFMHFQHTAVHIFTVW